jgi:hypothetical protein
VHLIEDGVSTTLYDSLLLLFFAGHQRELAKWLKFWYYVIFMSLSKEPIYLTWISSSGFSSPARPNEIQR